MEGIIFDIQRFSLNDGPGIRSIVFLKGCMLQCRWCHNPESKSNKPQLKYLGNKCIQCRKCESLCRNNVHSFISGKHSLNFENCILCGKCIEECDLDCLSIVGKKISAEKIMDIVERDRIYYEKSGGGLTISGGEPLYQAEFAIELAKEAKKRNLHVVVETSGFGDSEQFKKLTQFVDIFYFDCKHTNNDLHKKYVGVDLNLINKNRDYLKSIKKPCVLRCPIIPNYNFTEEHLRGIADIFKTNENIIRVDIMPYHSLGKSKAENIGSLYEMPDIQTLSNEEIENIIDNLKKLGVTDVRKG